MNFSKIMSWILNSNIPMMWNLIYLRTGCFISYHLGLTARLTRMRRERQSKLLNELMMTLFVEQPLALPMSAKYIAVKQSRNTCFHCFAFDLSQTVGREKQEGFGIWPVTGYRTILDTFIRCDRDSNSGQFITHFLCHLLPLIPPGVVMCFTSVDPRHSRNP